MSNLESRMSNVLLRRRQSPFDIPHSTFDIRHGVPQGVVALLRAADGVELAQVFDADGDVGHRRFFCHELREFDELSLPFAIREIRGRSPGISTSRRALDWTFSFCHELRELDELSLLFSIRKIRVIRGRSPGISTSRRALVRATCHRS